MCGELKAWHTAEITTFHQEHLNSFSPYINLLFFSSGINITFKILHGWQHIHKGRSERTNPLQGQSQTMHTNQKKLQFIITLQIWHLIETLVTFFFFFSSCTDKHTWMKTQPRWLNYTSFTSKAMRLICMTKILKGQFNFV